MVTLIKKQAKELLLSYSLKTIFPEQGHVQQQITW